jgi:predicted Zn-dependent protease
MNRQPFLRILLSLVVSSFVLFAGCVKNPVTGGRQLALISESQEIAIGEASHPEVLAEFGAVDNPALQEYFSRIGMGIAKVSHRPALPWHFTVVDTDVVNAFAIPGGYIYLTRGILAHMNNEAEMAGVVGHEIGHVTARHSVTQLSQQQLMGLGLTLGSVFSPTFRNLSGLAETGLSILMLKYSRDHERQSDQLGVQYMAQAGYDPEQISKFFQVFVTMSEESGSAIPNWLSSHPAPPDRIEATAAAAAREKSQNPQRSYQINADGFLQRLEGLVYGENPREGFVEGGRFVHPDLRFQFDVPQGWKVENTKSSVVITDPKGGAALQLAMASPEEGQTPEAVARNIGNQEGIQMLEGTATQLNGNPSFLGRYRAQTDSGILSVTAAFISYGGHIYQYVGLTPEASYANYARAFNASLQSFRQLTDGRILAVQPDRIRLYRARGGESLRSLAGSSAQSRITLEELARINRIDPDQKLAAGATVKLVTLGR